MMTCHDLAERIERLRPDAQPREVARLCLLLSNMVDDLDRLRDEDQLRQAWSDISLRLQSITDQHAAMTDELDQLARDNPSELPADGVWTLFRAIKTQSRVLDLYVGAPTAT